MTSGGLILQQVNISLSYNYMLIYLKIVLSLIYVNVVDSSTLGAQGIIFFVNTLNFSNWSAHSDEFDTHTYILNPYCSSVIFSVTRSNLG